MLLKVNARPRDYGALNLLNGLRTIRVNLLMALATRLESEITKETKQRLAELSGPDFAEAIRLATKEVAFRYTPQSLEDVAQRVLMLMEPAPAMDDPRFAAIQKPAMVREVAR